MTSYMVKPNEPTRALITRDETLYKPAEGADEFALALVAMGLISPVDATAEGLLISLGLPAGTSGIVVEMCAGECPHYNETGVPCGAVIRITSVPDDGLFGHLLGQEIYLSHNDPSDPVFTLAPVVDGEWTDKDDAALIAFLSDWDEGEPSDGWSDQD